MGWGHLKTFFSRATWPILTRLNTNHPWVKGIQVCSKEGDSPSPRGDNSERVKMHRKFLRIFFSRISWPKSIKLGTNYPWMKGIYVCSNKGPGSLQKGENHKNVEMGWGHLKILFSRITEPILTRLSKNHPWRERIQLCLKEGDSPSLRGDNSERVKKTQKIFKNLLQNQQAKVNQTWYKLSLDKGNLSLFK
jgi:hypothetical protein